MGTLASKFKKHLENGDEFAAMQLYQSSNDLRKNLDPNLSYGESHFHNTPLHYASAHAMKPLLRAFLLERNGNPNKKNIYDQTSLHLACQNNNPKSPTSHERRKACVALILQWRGISYINENDVKEDEVIDIAAVDDKENTALHYAAAGGLKQCVELLVSQGAPLFAENENKETPCDLAKRNGYDDITMYLESKIVFNTPITPADLFNENEGLKEPYCGLTGQELQEAKDMLLVETSDMLHIPLFSAEALLRNHEWSREMLLEMWMKDPLLCCERARIQPPTSALQFSTPIECGSKRVQKVPPSIITTAIVAEEYQLCHSLNSPIRTTSSSEEFICEICTSLIQNLEAPVHLVCEHQFCRNCWQCYLDVKIQEGDAHNITCPAYQCSRLVPVDVIESLVTPEMVRRYLQFDIQAFVESNPQIKWCPFPGCGRAVKLPHIDTVDPEVMNIPNTTPPAETSHAVDCGNGHFFCWECCSDAHAPCSCENWKKWHVKISEIKPEELKSTGKATEKAANCLWLVTNSKPCPNCKSPIQKNDGCNHMKCSKCKFDFCWVCLESWKKHNTNTGGYFRCNRFEAVNKAEERTGILISEAAAKNEEMRELNRFVHYYSRFKNHENSHKLEEPLLKTAFEKIKILAATSQQYSKQEMSSFRPLSRVVIDQTPSSSNDLSKEQTQEHSPSDQKIRFIEDAVKDLLKARRVLCGSYVYGYYLIDNGYNKTIFEFMQNELEEYTEKLSEMISRPCLRTSKQRIISTSVTVKRKLLEFLTAVSKGLVPPETPPNIRKNRKRKLPGLLGMDPVEDFQITQAMENSLKDIDPNNPWVKDAHGRHTNLLALFDWPDYESDEELEDCGSGICKRENCEKPRAKNPRTGEIHEFCSIQCSKICYGESESDDKTPFEFDYNMDLLIALEMSRLQMIEDMNKMKMAGVQVINVPTDSTEPTACSLPTKCDSFDENSSTKSTKSTTNEDVKCAPMIPIYSLSKDDSYLHKKEFHSNLHKAVSESYLDVLKVSIQEMSNTLQFDEQVMSSSGDETDTYVPPLSSVNMSFFLQNLEGMKEFDEKNLNSNSQCSKTSKKLVFNSKVAEKPYEESSL